MSNHVELGFKRLLCLDKGSKEYKEGLNRILQRFSIDDMQFEVTKAIERLPFPSGGFDLKYGSFDDGADIRMVGGQLLRTPSAVRTELFCPLMHSNEVKNRRAKWTPQYAAIVPNFHLPMRSYKVKNRTSTDDIKSLRLITAIKTPYLPDGRFDLEAYDSLINMQIEDGADGVIVGGATGEGQLMSWDEHIMLIGHTINCFGTAIKVIGNTGSNSTREEVHATEQGFAVGMHAAVHNSPFNGKTPYLPDRRFDLESYASAYASLVNIEAGADGVIVGGTTSEGQLMSWDEHSMLIGHTINCFETSRKVIGNSGSNSTREAVHATEQRFAVGMHAAVHINPFNGKTTYLPDWRFDLEAYASLVNIEDGADGVIVADSTNFAGVKECVGHDRVKESTKEGIIVWSGNDDECHVSRWDHDATGVISVASNLVPGLMHELLSKGKNPSLNKKLLPLISWLFCEPNPIGVNTALA